MYTKLIFSVVVIAFIAVQLAEANNTTKPLQCYNCINNNCKNAVLQTCDQKTANGTLNELLKRFYNFENAFKIDYHCLKSRYAYKNTTVMSLSGCVDFDPCNLIPNNSTWKAEQCMLCKDKNGCNPAGTLSSSASIMILSVFGLVLAKLFAL